MKRLIIILWFFLFVGSCAPIGDAWQGVLKGLAPGYVQQVEMERAEQRARIDLYKSLSSRIDPNTNQKTQIAQLQEFYGSMSPGFYGQPIPETILYEEGSIFLQKYTEVEAEIIETRAWIDGAPYMLKWLKLPSTWNDNATQLVTNLIDPNSATLRGFMRVMFKDIKKRKDVKLPDALDGLVLFVAPFLDSEDPNAAYTSHRQELINWCSFQAKGSKVWLFDIRFDETEYGRYRKELSAMASLATIDKLNWEQQRRFDELQRDFDQRQWQYKQQQWQDPLWQGDMFQIESKLDRLERWRRDQEWQNSPLKRMLDQQIWDKNYNYGRGADYMRGLGIDIPPRP